MRNVYTLLLVAAWPAAWLAAASSARANDAVRDLVESTIQPLMATQHIPGMAVGVIAAGRTRVFHFGMARLDPRVPVTDATLFELGSVSKTFTATLATWEQVRGHLSLADPVERYLPMLRGHPFGSVTLLQLGTHTMGGLPLQVPDEVRSEDDLMRYYESWKPAFAPGTTRTYANPGIGALGLIVARNAGQDFSDLMEHHLLPALGLTHTYLRVPSGRMEDYAEGYTRSGMPIRMKGDVLSPETYGLKSTGADLTRWLAINLGVARVNPQLERAVRATHTGYFQDGKMTQDVIWEQYPEATDLKDLEFGNSSAINDLPNPVTELRPPQLPRGDVWINKTGSTNGFSTYVAFIPDRHAGIVLLANKAFSNEARVDAADRILTALLAR